MHFCYILYSKQLERYYIGSTSDSLQSRLNKHNSNHKGYTGPVYDWQIVYSESFETVIEARRREREIKAKKSRKYIERLISKH